ncbi:MAG: hypothetical protein Q8922_07545 [Bacteroidota bacterium]|nr:hypothetical protein [Bacteroidota bacterium]MDP4233589.1 hypothetical protein [Bacteroidota bacterium]MDP4287776.1 hypothetical protein [Bacteroidota bacterium]
MRSIFLLILLLAPFAASAQTAPRPTPGRAKVDAGYKYQEKLADSTATAKQVIKNWSRIAQDTDVRRDPDALAVALSCEALLRLQIGEKKIADSVFARGMGRFRLKKSKAYFLVVFSDLDRELNHYERAMNSYEEIITTMDSIPELWDIDFYRKSGYAVYAYAIDASLGITRIGMANADYHKRAVELLGDELDRHPNDALGVMALVCLHHLGAINNEAYKFKLDLACSRKPELRDASETFEKQFKQ